MNNEKQIQRRITSMAAEACANHRDGYCLPADKPCTPLYQDRTIHAGAIACDYLMQAVIPQDKELNTVVQALINQTESAPWITADEPPPRVSALKSCAACGKAYAPISNRQKYCDTCRKTAEKKKHRDYMKKQRKGF